MNAIRYVSLAVCGAVLVLAAARPAALPSTAAREDQQSSSDTGAARPKDTGSDIQWEQIQDWVKQFCPNRLRFLESLNFRPAQKMRARQLIIDRYRQIQQIRDESLRRAMQAQVSAEDRVFGAQIEFRQARARNDKAGLEHAKVHLQAAVVDLVDAEVRQRQVRIERLQNEIQNLRQNTKQTFLAKIQQAGGMGPGNRATEDAAPPPPDRGGANPPDDKDNLP